MEEKVGKGKEEEEEEEQANKKIVKGVVSLVQHARSNPSIIYCQLFCCSSVCFTCGQHILHQMCLPSTLHYGSSIIDSYIRKICPLKLGVMTWPILS